MKAKIKYKENGRCISCLIDTNEAGYEEAEVESLDLNKNHKEPYLSEYKFYKIKNKTDELMSSKNYIFGLSSGWGKDEEYRRWCSSLINFCNSFEGKSIEVNKILFPKDPWGNQEALDL